MKEGLNLTPVRSLVSGVMLLQSRWFSYGFGQEAIDTSLRGFSCSNPGPVSVAIVEGCYLQIRTVGRAL